MSLPEAIPSASAAPADAIQLGVLILHPLEQPNIEDGKGNSWTELEPASCQPTNFEVSDTRLVTALRGLLRSRETSFGGEYKAVGRRLIVRCWLTPNDVEDDDAGGGAGGVGGGKSMETVLGALRRSWDDGEGPPLLGLGPGDRMRLFEIYASIPSPRDPQVGSSPDRRDIKMQECFKDHGPEGIQDSMKLFKFQLRSVARMFQMETKPARLADPSWTAIPEAGKPGDVFYLNAKTFEVRRSASWYPGVRGGILNEDMGVGKTLMALTLILATLHQPCSPPSSSTNETFITTAEREAYYPFPTDRQLRKVVGSPKTAVRMCAVPTLVDLTLNIVARSRNEVKVLDGRKGRPQHLVDDLEQRRPAFYHFPTPGDLGRRKEYHDRQVKGRVMPKRLFLSNATLVIVPSILIPQWMKEISQVFKTGTLDVLKIQSKGQMPSIEVLMDYDIILMSVNRFAREYKETSVLEAARWKRLLLDEGHVAGLSKTTNAMLMANKLNIERRWAISGTPTKNLQQGGDAGPASFEMSDVEPSSWSTRAFADVTSLGLIIGNFLGVEPFRSGANFQDIVTAELRNGPKFGAIPRLQALLSALMVKHRPGVIDQEIPLPPRTDTTVLLDFHPMAQKTYNALIALVACNVYTSSGGGGVLPQEGKKQEDDPGYFLHAKSKAAFNQVIRNLHLACLWYSSPTMDIARRLTQTTLDLKKLALTPAARIGLQEAERHLTIAIECPEWKEWMENGISVPFEAGDLPDSIRQSWSDSPSDDRAVDAHSLLVLREANLSAHSMAELEEMGVWSRRDKLASLNPVKAKRGSKGSKGDGAGKDAGVSTSAADKPVAAPIGSKAQKGKSKSAIDMRLEEAAFNANRFGASDLPRPLADTLHTVSRSSKVNFVIQTILAADNMDQFVIFGDTIELGHLTEALDLFEIKSCFAGRGISDKQREEALREFREQPEVRACLVQLELAAHGLNLISANRMILLSPIASPDIWAQAVKRIHRIGQIRPTTVQTLAIRGTIEEDIVNAKDVRTAEDVETHARALIKNPRFINSTTVNDPSPYFTINLVPISERSPLPPSTPPPLSDISAGTPESIILKTPLGDLMAEMDTSMGGEAGDESTMRQLKRSREADADGAQRKRPKGVSFA